MMNRIFYLFAAVVLLGACNQTKPAASAEAQASTSETAAALSNLNSGQAKALLLEQPATLILDVRTPGEYAGGHLNQALNLDYNAPGFRSQLEALDKTKPYLVYCAVGGRSSRAAQQMQELGFQQVYNVSGGGYPELKSAGIPVVQ